MKQNRMAPLSPVEAANRPTRSAVAYAFAIGTFGLFAWFIVARQSRAFDLAAIAQYRSNIAEGFARTLWVSLISLVGSTSLGFLFYLFSASRVRYLRAFTDVFTEIIYGTPLLVMIMIMAFVIGPAFGSTNRSAMGFIGLIVYITPYIKPRMRFLSRCFICLMPGGAEKL